jgi:hypothetical protein
MPLILLPILFRLIDTVLIRRGCVVSSCGFGYGLYMYYSLELGVIIAGHTAATVARTSELFL